MSKPQYNLSDLGKLLLSRKENDKNPSILAEVGFEMLHKAKELRGKPRLKLSEFAFLLVDELGLIGSESNRVVLSAMQGETITLDSDKGYLSAVDSMMRLIKGLENDSYSHFVIANPLINPSEHGEAQ